MATRLESRKSLLSSDPAFSQQPNVPYPQSYDPTDHNDHSTYSRPTYPQAPQPTYIPPTYAETNTMDQSAFDQGYAHREEGALSLPASKPRKSFFGFMSSKWAAMFMGVTAIQAVICLCFEA